MQEYYPADFAKVRKWVARGRWFPAGSSWEENDVDIPSTESLIRQILYGRQFFKKEFNTESHEYMLPDSFGFPASLPSVLAHCGIRGFSTQKLTWGSASGIPFNLGVWAGLDGGSVIAALNANDYNTQVKEDLSVSALWRERLNTNGSMSGVFADYQYYGVGDRGGAPPEESVQWVEKSATSTGAVRVVSAKADQLFCDLTDAQKARLPKYQGDLLLTEHLAGTLTSQAYLKRWNHMNENLADAAEKASVAAHLLGATPYPREKLSQAWKLVLGAQFHDILAGTSLPKCYEYSWNDEIIAMNCFASVLENAVGGVARAMNTQTKGIPLIVFNPLSIDREDVVEAELPAGSTGATVHDGNGNPVPTQVLSTEGAKRHLLFLAKAPSIGFTVYEASSGEALSRLPF
ncbi:MAG: alpha-mannosidase [Pedosphaera sp.]|nr:alpha-mannosidase [Pedosphaera sp.]